MIKHLVFWKLKESAHGNSKHANALEIQRLLTDLQGKIPGLLAIEVGLDLSQTPNSSDIALYSEFESEAALLAYQSHPLHQAIVPFVAEAAAERRVVDYHTP
ncbi:MAG: Dabb family protein [Rhodoferax sp.]|nr:Dabb family protein [Rhodoferax sp.]